MSTTLTKNQKKRLKLLEQQKKKQEEYEFLDSLIKENEIKKDPVEVSIPDVTADSDAKLTPDKSTSDSTTPDKPSSTSVVITREQIKDKAAQFWKDVQQYVKTHPEFKNMEDKRKMDFFRDKLGYDMFMSEFPIVSRYMICLGQFNMKAFVRFLDKCEKTIHPPAESREKGYNEDQWVRRQADYVQYLWESYQKGHYNNAEKQWIWQETYKRLKGEFDDFRNMHKDIENKVKEEKVMLQAQNARELLERLVTGQQKLSPEEEVFLLDSLQELSVKRTFSNVLTQLKSKHPEVEPKCVAQGQGPENVPKVTMIETVEAERMHEIDDKYKPEELRGMELDHAINPIPEDASPDDASPDDANPNANPSFNRNRNAEAFEDDLLEGILSKMDAPKSNVMF